jgi:putative nucleotidyltransferase with HDIG domain
MDPTPPPDALGADEAASKSRPVSEDLRDFVADMGSLPSLPSLYMQLTEELREREVSSARIGRIISKDLAMTSKILQIVNSAYFGLSRQISSVDRAILLMGLEMIRTFVLSVEVFSMFEPKKMTGLTVAGLWRHSMSCAAMARRIAASEGYSRAMADHVATAAFLHDIGKLLMANERPEKYRDVGGVVLEEGVPVFEAEKRVFGFDHAEAGGVLLERWKLPESIVEAVFRHHVPRLCDEGAVSPLTIIHVADYLEHRANGGEFSQAVELDEVYLGSVSALERLALWESLADTNP